MVKRKQQASSLDYGPPLTEEELRILRVSDYNDPLFVSPRRHNRIALCDSLVKRDLLERHPNGGCYRRTSAGEQVLCAWRKAGFSV